MCGIGGIIDEKGVSPAVLSALSRALAHRGPDGDGELIEGPVGLAHRRLAILDPSPRGDQPMSTADGLLTVVHSGEVYNYREIREELEGEGVSCVTGTDTEVVLRAYELWGAEAVPRFRGMWAFAILDRRLRRLFLSRDPFGIKPLSYVSRRGLFAFASEQKALFAVDGVRPEADGARIASWVAWGAAGEPHEGLFRGIRDLPPGYNMTVGLDDQSVQVERYYDLASAVPFDGPTDPGEAASAYRSLLERSVSLHLRSDVPVGSCLSGGLDSSSVVAFAASMMEGREFRTFTASWPGEPIDEGPWARRVADHLPSVRPFFTTPSTEGFIDEYRRFARHQDLPVGSLSPFSQWQVMKLAGREGAKVLLDGQGADETLGGYSHFAGSRLAGLLRSLRLGSFLRERRLLKENFTGAIDEATGRALFHFFPASVRRAVRGRMRPGLKALRPELRELARREPFPGRGGRSFRELSLTGVRHGLCELLRYEDRSSMAFSIEARVPFLEQDLVEYTIALPGAVKVRGGWSKAVLRDAVAPLLPAEVAWRRGKLGFVAPQERWRRELRPRLLEYVASAPAGAVFDRAYLLDFCSGEGGRNIDLSEFWRIFSLLAWLEVFEVTVR